MLKKQLIVLMLFSMFLTQIYAGGIDYLSQKSADYLRVLSRNAATEGLDMVSYNPAGMALLADGLYLQLNNQSLFKDYSINAKTAFPGETELKKFSSTEPTLALPSFFAAYKKNKLALFLGALVTGGGGTLKYDDGVYVLPFLETGLQQTMISMDPSNPHNAYAQYVFAKMNSASFTGSSVYLALNFGGAYQVTDMISVSLAIRYVNAKRTYEGEGNFSVINGALFQAGDPNFVVAPSVDRALEAEKTASGIGAVIGLNIKPNDKMNIGIRYETQTTLEFETDITRNDWSLITTDPMSSFQDGYKQRKDLPAILGLGFSYQLMDALNASLGLNYYFNEQADQGADDGIDDDYENGYEAQIGFEYQVLEKLAASFGYNYVVIGGNEDTYYDFEYQLDAHFFGCGAKYDFTDKMSLSGALNLVNYIDGDGKVVSGDVEVGSATYKKKIYVVSFGIQYKLF